MQMFYIYEITNNLNGKNYVGQRHCPLNKTPWTDRKYMGKGTAIQAAEEKYGIENFSKFILAVCYNQAILDVLENAYISDYKSKGKAEYNIAPGGHPAYYKYHGGSRSEEGKRIWKEKITKLYENDEYRKSHSEKIKNEYFYAATSSSEYKAKLSVATKQMWSDEKKKKEIAKKISLGTKGIRKSEETKKNISKGIKNSEKFKKAMASEEHKKKLSKSIKNSKKHWDAVHSESFLIKCRENAKHRTPAQIEVSKKLAKCALGKRWFTSPDGKCHLIKPEDSKPGYIRGRIGFNSNKNPSLSALNILK